MDNKDLEVISKLLDEKLKPVLDSQARMEKKIDSIVEQTADLIEFRTEAEEKLTGLTSEMKEARKDLSRIEVATADNWSDIAKLKAIK